jgi:predicted TIM-barrel fold metal-dependent hydrolase
MKVVGGIDAVANLFTPQVVESRPEWTKKFHANKNKLPKHLVEGTPIDLMVQMLIENGFGHAFLISAQLGRRGLPGSWSLAPETVLDVVQEHPNYFSGLYGINPFDSMKGVREMERMVKDHGFIGAHIYPHWFEKSPDDPIYYPFYTKCAELDIPIQIQVGYCRIYEPRQRLESVGRPSTIDKVACDIPELKIVGIHVGWPWTEEMISVADKHKNVYIGTDRHPPRKWGEVLVNYLSTWGQDKVLFGTDFPVVPYDVARKEMKDLNLSAEIAEKLERTNAISLYRLNLEG